MFFQGQGQCPQQMVSAIDAQGAVELMGKFDGFSGVAAVAGQGRQRDGVRAQSDGVIGIDHALIVQGQAAGEVEAAW